MPIIIAAIEAEIPQEAGLFFPGMKERPTEDPFMALEKKYCNEELQWKARIAPNHYN